jgi:ribosomal protein L37AE/L43A
MRAAIITLGGLVGSSACLLSGLALDGLPGAILVLVAIIGATLTIGWAVAHVTGIRPGPRLGRPRAPGGMRVRVRGTRSGRTVARSVRNPQRCSQCRSKRELRGHVWVCPKCDFGVGRQRTSSSSPEQRPEIT